jgi:hypothetical protein
VNDWDEVDIGKDDRFVAVAAALGGRYIPAGSSEEDLAGTGEVVVPAMLGSWVGSLGRSWVWTGHGRNVEEEEQHQQQEEGWTWAKTRQSARWDRVSGHRPVVGMEGEGGRIVELAAVVDSGGLVVGVAMKDPGPTLAGTSLLFEVEEEEPECSVAQMAA